MRIALTIAGSDSGGGAGIQADLKTFAAHGVFGTSAVTAITVQNTLGITSVTALSPDLVASQIDAVVSDLGADATKIGMLVNADIVEAVAAAILGHRLTHIVLDPVMAGQQGGRLLDERGVAMLRDRLLPLATVVTPNVAEAEVLTGLTVRALDGQRRAAARLIELGAHAALVKGGHLEGPAIDVLYDGRVFVELRAERIATVHTHGTGCTLASAIAARLARGDDLTTAARGAKTYVTRAIQQAPGLGHGHGPLQHFPVEME
jgi:hydroxymethylpyrimidine/phosphomethylpyrimidine kinase